jgi:hypothetical protein
VSALEAEFSRAGIPALSPGIWKLWGVRPANAPARRIAAAAALLDALGEPSALLRILDARTVNEAIAPLVALRASGFWRDHHDLCAGAERLPAAYIGRARALEMLVNVVLPAAYAWGGAGVRAKATAVLARLPRPQAYGVTRYLEQAISSDGVRVRLNAERAQGLLALNREWCTQNGCGRCPLS